MDFPLNPLPTLFLGRFSNSDKRQPNTEGITERSNDILLTVQAELLSQRLVKPEDPGLVGQPDLRRQVAYPGWLFVLFALYFLQTGLVGGILVMGGVSWYEGLPLALRVVPAYELAGCVALVYLANRYRKFIAPDGRGN